jgi:hypothetical protein
MLGGYSASFLDARGKLVTRSYDILGSAEFFFFAALDHKVPVYSMFPPGFCRLLFNFCIPEA